MRLEALQAALRPRSAWEAMELGSALVRRHARRIWSAWLLASLPVFALCNLLAWSLERMWLAALLMWWLKPWFDRIPLFVLSRAVFGHEPGLRESVAALWRFGRGTLLRDLTWARLSAMRSTTLPVAALEGLRGKRLRQRRALVSGADAGPAIGLTFVCLHFELILYAAALALVLVFIPIDWLGESLRALVALWMAETPWWLELATNAVLWGATTVIEPFYVGAGFGLYLNRRTHLEAWDIEIALRRLQRRLRVAAAGAAMLLVAALPMVSLQAMPLPIPGQMDVPTEESAARVLVDAPLDSVLPAAAGEAEFGRALERAGNDPLLRPTREVGSWKRREPKPEGDSRFNLDWLPDWLGEIPASLLKLVLWALVGLLLVWLLWRSRHWWPALWRGGGRIEPPPPVDTAPTPHADALPADIAGAAQALWREGRKRAALALLYRGSVEVMLGRTGVALPPGATEAQCLRTARRMPEAQDRDTFVEVVRAWQYAAYAQRMPEAADFHALLARADARFWSRGA